MDDCLGESLGGWLGDWLNDCLGDLLCDSFGVWLDGCCFVGWFGNWVFGWLVGINIRRAYVQASFYSRYVVVLLIFRYLELG